MKHAAPKTYHTVKTVLLVFVLSLLIFGGVMLLPLWLSSRTASPPAQVGTTRGRTRHFTLLFYDTAKGLTGAVILTTDTAACTAQTIGFAPSVAVSHNDTTVPLSVVFDQDGEIAAAAALSNLTGIAAEGPLTFSVSNVAAFLVQLQEHLPFTLDQAVGTLSAGNITLTPMQVADVLRFDNWNTGATGQAAAHAGIVAALLNRYLVPRRNLQEDFAALTAVCDTRLTISHFEAAKDGLLTLAAANDGTLCTVA